MQDPTPRTEARPFDNVSDVAVREPEPSRLPRWLTETPYWAVSAVAHLIILLIIGGVVLSRQLADPPETNAVVRTVFKERPYDPKLPNDTEYRPEILEETQNDKVFNPQPVPPVKPKGEPDKLDSRLDQSMINNAFGTSGGYSGRYGELKGKLQAVGNGSPPGEDSVLAALWWLVRHQSPDGSWKSDGFFLGNAMDPNAYADERYGMPGFDVGVTGLAMLAFLGYAHTHQQGKIPEFRRAMRLASQWMTKQQIVDASRPEFDGVFGYVPDCEQWMYNHAIATLAMSELLLMSGDQFRFARPVERAVRHCMRAQNPGYGWKYGYRSGRNDTSVTGWMVLALKTAKSCSEFRYLKKIQTDEYAPHLADALNWLDRATSTQSGVTGYESPGDEGSRLTKAYPEPYPYSKRLSCMSAVALLCRLFANQPQSSEPVKRSANVLAKELPEWRKPREKRKSTINFYYWYYGSYAMYQYGGSKWREWSAAMLDALLPNQRSGGDHDGSWDPIGEWGAAGGRVYSTAINAMTLEVFYRYQRTQPDRR